MASAIGNLHDDLIHDAALDYYGKRLATCSSDKTIKIFDLDGENHKLVETLRGHEGPVWQVSWAHPKFGNILASASFDGQVLIWRQDDATKAWSNIAQHKAHDASVNSVQWSPPELGAAIVCASSDGNVSVVDFKDDGNTSAVTIHAHSGGCNSAVWAQINGSTSPVNRRFVTGGCDGLIKVWTYDPNSDNYVEEAVLEGHSDWVRDLAWAPSVLPKAYLASASDDKSVIIWTQDGPGAAWKKVLLQSEKFPETIWRVSWSLSGNVLAVSGGDNRVSLWKENLAGEWEQCGTVDPE
ncbi:WD40-repeat-containing domain protein [Dipodascopsis uninucleata]